jgi:hypothetical protein
MRRLWPNTNGWQKGLKKTEVIAGSRLPHAGLINEADDAVQEAWLRLGRSAVCYSQ